MSLRTALALLGILVAAFALRAQSVSRSEVASPIRADARQYLLYAHNLRSFGVYSCADTWAPGAPTPPEPDALRPPGYPLFLLAFLSNPPRLDDVATIARAQAIISTLTVGLVYLLGRHLLPAPLALAAAALAAASPHLVTLPIYVLSETLFGLLLALALLLGCRLARVASPARSALAGATFAAAALTHPQATYFVVPLAVFLLFDRGWRRGAPATAACVLAFAAVYGVWSARNVTRGVSGDDALMLRAIRIGVYRDFMYQDRPETYAYPYRYDPRYEETSTSLGAVLREVADRIAEAPGAQLGWYFRKPLRAWDWNEVQGAGGFFVYPVVRTPYAELPHFRITHLAMRSLHVPLVALMAVGVALAWLPARRSRIERDVRFGARLLSLLVLYHAATMTVGFPLTRFSVPLYPCLYVLAMLPLAVGFRGLAERRRLQRSLGGRGAGPPG